LFGTRARHARACAARAAGPHPPCPLQPRKNFSPEALRELADSIREQGIVQPLIVRERGGFLN